MSYQDMHGIVRCALQLRAEGEKVRITEDGVHAVVVKGRIARHAGVGARVIQGAAGRREVGVHGGVLVPVPVPVRQTEALLAGQFLADLLEKEQIGAMPGKEVAGAVLTEVETARDRAVQRRLCRPAAWIAARQRLHCGHCVLVNGDGVVDARRAHAQPAPHRPVADLFGDGFAPPQQGRVDETQAHETQALHEHAPAHILRLIEYIPRRCLPAMVDSMFTQESVILATH